MRAAPLKKITFHDFFFLSDTTMFLTRTLHGPGTPVAAAVGFFTGAGGDSETVVAAGRSVTLWREAGPGDAEPVAGRVLDVACVPGVGEVRRNAGRGGGGGQGQRGHWLENSPFPYTNDRTAATRWPF